MDHYKTHGAFSWQELTTTDPQAASAFYGDLFGWSVQQMGPEMGNYRVASVGKEGVGGIMACADGTPQVPRWTPVMTVDDADATVTKCTALGGKVMMAAMDVPTVGRMAVLQDPQGAVFTVMHYTGTMS